MSARHVIAIDLGATSGRVMDAAFDGERLQLSEIAPLSQYPGADADGSALGCFAALA